MTTPSGARAGGRVSPLRPFRQRAFAVMWAGAFVSNVGTWMETVAVGVWVTQTTGQAAWTGTVAALTYVPAATAATPDLVPPEELLGALSLNIAQYNLGRVVGPALAGLVIGMGGLAWAFGLNTVSFGAVLVALALIRLPPVRHRQGEPIRVWATIVAGLAAARRDAGIRTALLLLVATTLLVSPFIGLVPAVAIKVFHRGAAGTSALVTAQGVGAVAAALAASPLAVRFGHRRLLVAALLAVGPAAALYGLAPTFLLAVAGITVLGFCYLGVLSGTSAVCQALAPRALRARIASLVMVGVGGGHALGLVVQGWLGDRVGLPPVTAATAALLFAIVLATRLLRPDLVRAMQATSPPAPAVAPPVELAGGPRAVPPVELAGDPRAGPPGAARSAEVHALQPPDGQRDGERGHQQGEHDGADRAEPGREGQPRRPERGGQDALGIATDRQRRG